MVGLFAGWHCVTSARVCPPSAAVLECGVARRTGLPHRQEAEVLPYWQGVGMDRSDKIFALIVMAALAAAIFLAMGRARIEDANRVVEIIIDADDARSVAATAGKPLPELLGQFRKAGVGALAVREMTLGDLKDSGRIMAMSMAGETSIITPDGGLAALMAPSLASRLPQLDMRLSSPPPVITISAPAEELAEVPALLRPEDLVAAQDAGLRVVARLRNFPGATPAAIEAAALQAKASGARLVIFDKEEVLGFDGLVSETAEAFENNDLLYGFVEMAAQRGDVGLARRISRRVIRVHSITEADMLTMTPVVAVPRYARAVAERNIRAVYVRLLTRPQAGAAEANLRYVKGVAEAIRANGFRLGPPAPFTAPPVWPPVWPRALVALGVLAGGVLLLRRFIPVGVVPSWVLFVGLVAVGGGLAVLRSGLVAQLGGLGAAVIFPTLSVVWALQGARGAGARGPAGPVLGQALRRLLVASAISLTGAMLIVGLYSRVGHMSGIGLFVGVKASLLLPLVLIFAAVVVDLPGRGEPVARWWQRARLRSEQFLRQPLTVLQAAVVLVLLGALAFVLTRSGNQPVVSPSAFEVKFRALLENVLVIRPRTKEFLLGHPALMLAIALGLRGRRAWLPLVAVLAGLGQVSLLNTYCHFHTPLYVSLTRSLNGLWLGALIGILVIAVWRLLLDRGPRRHRAPRPATS